jgi:hypothetical protein
MPVKHFDMQAAMNTHLPQSIGTGALDGQHGMSLAISSVIADGDASAITGCEIGANAKPAITRIANSRRIVIWRFIPQIRTEWRRLVVRRG